MIVLYVEEWTGAGAALEHGLRGGSLNLARRMLGSAGTRDSALGFGGVNPSATQANRII